jgi:hypothetical protein
MLPYFYRLNVDLLTAETKQDLVDDVLQNHLQEMIISETGKNNFRTNILYSAPNAAYFGRHPGIAELLNSLLIKPSYTVLLLQRPGDDAKRHRDMRPDRETALSIPLCPTTGYSSTLFWKQKVDEQHVAVCDFTDNMTPIFLNTDEFHGVEITHDYRLNFQVSFAQKIDRIVELWETGTLFSREYLDKFMKNIDKYT